VHGNTWYDIVRILISADNSNSLYMWDSLLLLSCPKRGLHEIKDLTATPLTEVCFQVCILNWNRILSIIHMSSIFPPQIFKKELKLDLTWPAWMVFGEVNLIDILLFLIHLPLLSVPPHFLQPLRGIRMSGIVVREFMRFSMHASFTPMIMLATGWLAHEATVFYKLPASHLSDKWGDEYSVILS